MPAALNEPVNLLQRLCEELEYSELLDTANNTQDPYQRMVRLSKRALYLSDRWETMSVQSDLLLMMMMLYQN